MTERNQRVSSPQRLAMSTFHSSISPPSPADARCSPAVPAEACENGSAAHRVHGTAASDCCRLCNVGRPKNYISSSLHAQSWMQHGPVGENRMLLTPREWPPASFALG